MICPFVSVSKIIHNISYLIGLDKQCFIMFVDYIITNGFLQCATICENNMHSKNYNHSKYRNDSCT